jgi:hypothetical protein
MAVSTELGIWVAAILSLFVYTYFVREQQNPLYRFAQTTVVGASIGYTIVMVLVKTLDAMVITNILSGKWIYIIPFLIGLMFYSRFIRGYEYISRYPIAIIVATGLGLAARASIEAELFTHALATANLLITGGSPINRINNLIYFIGVVLGIFYFYFTLGEKAEKQTSTIRLLGRYYILLLLGQRYGGTILYRTNLILGRLQFLLWDWLGLG